MQVFRRKYLYNLENPVFQSEKVRTYNCVNTETKNNRLLLLQHLTEPPQVLPQKSVLQPIEFPTTGQQYSVYPLVSCCSEISKLNENDAMYIIKCLVECKLKNPLYYVIGPEGISCSEVEGLLPDRSPDLFSIVLDILDLPSNLMEVEKSIVSKNGYEICRAIRDKQPVDPSSFAIYGWKDAKKLKEDFSDDQFVVFKGRRKEQGPFNEEYALAWNPKHNICRFKFVDLIKDSYEDEFYEDFRLKIDFFEKNEIKAIKTLSVYKMVKDSSSLRLYTSVANQGNLSDFVARRSESGKRILEEHMLQQLQGFIKMMNQVQKSYIQGHSALHIKNVYIHNNRLTLGEPLFVTDKKEKKLRDLKKGFDYFAPEFKENIILPEKLFKLDQEKMDVWSFGFLLHKILTNEVPVFDNSKKPLLEKENLSSGMRNLIKKCLDLDPALRPRWREINLRNLQPELVSEYKEELNSENASNIRLDLPSRERKIKLTKDQDPESSRLIVEQEAKVMAEQEPEPEEKFEYSLPPQMSSKLKRIKLTVKIIIIMVMYVMVFFGPFLANSFNILILKDSITRTPLHLTDESGNILSTTTILTAESRFFLLNDISFTDVQNVYHCINDSFDPINNPDYSLVNYLKSGSFDALILTGWAAAVVICVVKSLAIWKGGISNKPRKQQHQNKYWLVYGFFELSMASLLFAHFFIYQFFYFSGISPCFSIEEYSGVEPFFDSSLYLFLSNEDGYMENIFSSLGVLAILLTISACFYAWGPKLDTKYFTSVPSILCRIIPYCVLFLLCRIGVFMLFSPTALNDSTDIIPSILGSSSRGFFGIIPEVFVMICIAIQALLEWAMHWCEQKASQNDSLSKMFDVNNKKTLQRNSSNSKGGINDLSLQHSRQNLNEYE